MRWKERSKMQVELLVRENCGSCERVRAQIEPLVKRYAAGLRVVDVDKQGLAAEFGDRVPVVLIDGDEFACWEVDNEDLEQELALKTQ